MFWVTIERQLRRSYDRGKKDAVQDQKPVDDTLKGGDIVSDQNNRTYFILANVNERNYNEEYSTYCESLLLGVDGVVYANNTDLVGYRKVNSDERAKFLHDLKVGVKLEQKHVEWSQDDLICLGYLADFVDKNGDNFYGNNKSNVVKWIRSFAELPIHMSINEIEQKPVEWKAADEQNLSAVLSCIKDEFLRRWFKDVLFAKYEKNVEWNEDDKWNILVFCNALDLYKEPVNKPMLKSWLKSLRPQSHWKPTETQLEALRAAAYEPYKPDYITLQTLHEDLTQL